MAQGGEKIYGAEKLAKFFGVTKETAREWCKKGKLPGFKIGKEWKVRVADLQKMIERKIKIARPREEASANVTRDKRRRTKANGENAAPRLF